MECNSLNHTSFKWIIYFWIRGLLEIPSNLTISDYQHIDAVWYKTRGFKFLRLKNIIRCKAASPITYK